MAKSLAMSHRANRCPGIQQRAWRGELERLVFLHKPMSLSLRSAASQSPSLSTPELACTEDLDKVGLARFLWEESVESSVKPKTASASWQPLSLLHS